MASKLCRGGTHAVGRIWCPCPIFLKAPSSNRSLNHSHDERNPGLYSYFVKPGHFKTVFSDSDEDEGDAPTGDQKTKNGKTKDSSATSKSERKLKRRQEKEARRAEKAKRKLAKEAARANPGEPKPEEKDNGDGTETGESVPDKAEERAAKRERKAKRKRATGGEAWGDGESATTDTSGVKTNGTKKLSRRNSKVRDGSEEPASDLPAPAAGAVDAAARVDHLDGSAKKTKKRKRAREEAATGTGLEPESIAPSGEEQTGKDGTKKRKKKDKSRTKGVETGEEIPVRKASAEPPAVLPEKNGTKPLEAEGVREAETEKPTPKKKSKRKAKKGGEPSEANGAARRDGELTANGTRGSSASDAASADGRHSANGHLDKEAGAVGGAETHKKKAKKKKSKEASVPEGSAMTEGIEEDRAIEAVSAAGKKGKKKTNAKVQVSSDAGTEDGASLVTAKGNKKEKKKKREQERAKGSVAEGTVVSPVKPKRGKKSKICT